MRVARGLGVLLFLTASCAAAKDNSCPPLKPRNATSVHDLSPADIRVVAALGDSITAGYGALGFGWLLPSFGAVEYRGRSWSIGNGTDNTTTLPSLLAASSTGPTVKGASAGEHDGDWCYNGADGCGYNHTYGTQDNLNGALSGTFVYQIADQLLWVISQMEHDTSIDYYNDWKVITILTGANDLCIACAYPVDLAAANYGSTLQYTLELIRTYIPRAFVNVVMLPDFSKVWDAGKLDPTGSCQKFHTSGYTSYECACAFQNDTSRSTMQEQTDAYNAQIKSVVSIVNSNHSDSFAVALHPGTVGVNLTALGPSVLSTVDCFHPAVAMHEAMAVNLWNSMLTPSANRKPQFDFDASPICADTNSRLYTS